MTFRRGLLANTLKMHPRSVSRALRREQLHGNGSAQRAGSPQKYTAEVDAALRLLFDEMEGPCAENMRPSKNFFNSGKEKLLCWAREWSERRRGGERRN
jgi:hypothetical protein